MVAASINPEAQGLAAMKLLAECGVLPIIKVGRISEAIAKAAPIWPACPT